MIGLYFVFGAIVGSFLNVCAYRLPLNKSVVFPGSHCGACGAPVRWHDNIPMLSYLFLRGRCRDCKARFSIQYPLIELLAGLLFVLTYLKFGFQPRGYIFLIFSCAILTQTVIDFRHKIIPDVITLPGIVLGLLFNALFPELQYQTSPLWGAVHSLIGILVGGGILYLMGTIAEWVMKREAMGGGDVKLLAMIGAFLGYRGVFWALFLGSLSGALVGIWWRLKKKEEEIPFGPFLGLGSFLYIYYGGELAALYRHLIGY